MKLFLKYFMCLFFIFALMSNDVLAKELSDLTIAVTSNLSETDGVKAGQKIVFHIQLSNSGTEEKEVSLSCNQAGWSKKISVKAGEMISEQLDYIVPDLLKKDSKIEFLFSADCEGTVVTEKGKTNFSYNTLTDGKLKMDVQLKREQAVIIGKDIYFEIVLKNTGTTEIKNINITHSLGEENLSISTLMPGEEKTTSIKYLLPNTVKLNQDITNKFVLTANDMEEIETEVVFMVPGEQGMTSDLVVTPNQFGVGEEVTTNFGIQNTGTVPYENLEVTNSRQSDWSEKVNYLAALGTVNVKYQFVVSEEDKNITFYLKSKTGELLSEKTIQLHQSLNTASDTKPDQEKYDELEKEETNENGFEIPNESSLMQPETDLKESPKALEEAESSSEETDRVLEKNEIPLAKTGEGRVHLLVLIFVLVSFAVLFTVVQRWSKCFRQK